MVRAACDRAGLPRVGAHRLRHTAATQMLRAGASLPEIGQILRHREQKTTAIYADPALKEEAIARTAPLGIKPGRYRPSDALLAFLEDL